MFISVCFIHAQEKHAMIIGLGEQEDKSWSKINGDKDVPYVKSMLKKANFPYVIELTNSKATKDNIIKGFKYLIQKCKPNDIVYIHFSGHGQQMCDDRYDESDGLDECWIPYDAYVEPCSKDSGEKHLSDDEVNFYLREIRKKVGEEGKILVIIDACHSGTSTRGDEEGAVRGVYKVFKIKSSTSHHAMNAAPQKRIPPYSSANPNTEEWISISACGSGEVNIEMKNPTVGKLTYALCQIIQKESSTHINNPLEENKSFFKNLSEFIDNNSGSRPQTPEISGDTTKYSVLEILQ
jgi:hypothetical protein